MILSTLHSSVFSEVFCFSFYQDDVCIESQGITKHCKLIAVHAGLEKQKSVEEQLKYLKARDTRIPKVVALSGRKNVWEIPQVNARLPCKILVHSPISRASQ